MKHIKIHEREDFAHKIGAEVGVASVVAWVFLNSLHGSSALQGRVEDFERQNISRIHQPKEAFAAKASGFLQKIF